MLIAAISSSQIFTNELQTVTRLVELTVTTDGWRDKHQHKNPLFFSWFYVFKQLPSIDVFEKVIRSLIKYSLENEDSANNGQCKSRRSPQNFSVKKVYCRHVIFYLRQN